MPNLKNSPAAFAAKMTAFGTLFASFCLVMDPMTAFVFTLAASAVLSST